MELHVIEREGRKTVVLLDNEMRIVKPVYDYLKFQRQKDKEKIYYIQQQADELSAEISKLMKKDADLSEKHLNELIKLGVFISMTCQELLDEE